MQVVDTGLNLNLVDIYGQMTRLELARMHKLIGGRVRRMRTLQDCPEQSYGFRPFLLSSPDDPEYLFRPTAVDSGPMASALQAFLLENN